MTTNFKNLLHKLACMTKDEAHEYLATQLKKISHSEEDVNSILATYEEARGRMEPLPVLTNLFNNYFLDQETLKTVLSYYSYRNPLDYYVDLINCGDDNMAVNIVYAIEKIFPLDNYQLNLLYKMTDDVEEEKYENKQLRAYFSDRLNEDAKPVWVRNSNDHEHAIGDVDNNLKHSITDDDVFRAYGPINSLPRSIDEDENICSIYGGCRMLLCNEYEHSDLMMDDEIPFDWFKRKCDECNRKIKKRHYALRIPLVDGGWEGCYCSFECLAPHSDQTLLTVFKKQITEIGIEDR